MTIREGMTQHKLTCLYQRIPFISNAAICEWHDLWSQRFDILGCIHIKRYISRVWDKISSDLFHRRPASYKLTQYSFLTANVTDELHCNIQFVSGCNELITLRLKLKDIKSGNKMRSKWKVNQSQGELQHWIHFRQWPQLQHFLLKYYHFSAACN
jgi:hypothetical protein